MAFANGKGQLAPPPHLAPPQAVRPGLTCGWLRPLPPPGPSPRQVTARLQGASPGSVGTSCHPVCLGLLGKGCHPPSAPAHSCQVAQREREELFPRPLLSLSKVLSASTAPHPSLKTRPASEVPAATGAEGTTWDVEGNLQPPPLLASVRPCALLSPLLRQQPASAHFLPQYHSTTYLVPIPLCLQDAA